MHILHLHLYVVNGFFACLYFFYLLLYVFNVFYGIISLGFGVDNMRNKKEKTLLIYQGNLLKKYRKENTSLTMESAAQKLGKAKTWLSDIENGRNNIYAQDVIKLLEIYNVDVNDFARNMMNYIDKINE